MKPADLLTFRNSLTDKEKHVLLECSDAEIHDLALMTDCELDHHIATDPVIRRAPRSFRRFSKKLIEGIQTKFRRFSDAVNKRNV